MSDSAAGVTAIAPARGIIFEDAEIRVILRLRHAPSSPAAFTLVTFGDLIGLADGLSFFADPVVEQADLYAIGIMAKRPNWYPASSLRAASAAIRAAILPDADTILYGGSMGGYAAIKFSKLLGATHVLALCPQWSLDPAECGGVNPGWQQHFRPRMRGMGIRAEDTAGRIFVLSDRYDATDRWHLGRILEACPAAQTVGVPWVAHHVTTVLAGSGNLLALLAACRAQDLAAMRRVVRQVRASHVQRRLTVIEAAQKRRKPWVLSLYVAAAMDFPAIVSQRKPLFLPAVLHLARAGRVAEALAFCRRFSAMREGVVPSLVSAAAIAQVVGGHVVARTPHGTTLYYDFAMNVVRHGHPAAVPYALPLLFEVSGQKLALAVEIGGARFYLRVMPKGHLAIPPDTDQREAFPFRLQEQEGGCFSICLDDGYVSAEPSGRVIGNRPTAKHWELFAFDVQQS